MALPDRTAPLHAFNQARAAFVADPNIGIPISPPHALAWLAAPADVDALLAALRETGSGELVGVGPVELVRGGGRSYAYVGVFSGVRLYRGPDDSEPSRFSWLPDRRAAALDRRAAFADRIDAARGLPHPPHFRLAWFGGAVETRDLLAALDGDPELRAPVPGWDLVADRTLRGTFRGVSLFEAVGAGSMFVWLPGPAREVAPNRPLPAADAGPAVGRLAFDELSRRSLAELGVADPPTALLRARLAYDHAAAARDLAHGWPEMLVQDAGGLATLDAAEGVAREVYRRQFAAATYAERLTADAAA